MNKLLKTKNIQIKLEHSSLKRKNWLISEKYSHIILVIKEI